MFNIHLWKAATFKNQIAIIILFCLINARCDQMWSTKVTVVNVNWCC